MSLTAVNERELEIATQRSALLSIKPVYVDAILRGEKTIELRRKPPTVSPGSTIFLYSTSPTSQLTGTAILGRMISAAPDEFWRKYAQFTGVDRATFEAYFEGADVAHGLEVHTARRAHAPLTLTRMREIEFSPPQSWRYVDPESSSYIIRELKLAASSSDDRTTLLNETLNVLQGMAVRALREVRRER